MADALPRASIHLRVDDLRGPEIAALLEEHLDGMRKHSPPDSVHALDLDRLRVPEITFWTAWEVGREQARKHDALLACGALRELDASSGEIKSMRTSAAHLRRGAAAAILAEIIAEARRRGYRHLHLETGSAPAFVPAQRMYAKAGFVRCGPFGSYVADDFSVFMTKAL